MLCRNSTRLGQPLRSLLIAARPYSANSGINQAKPLQTPEGPSSAISTSAAQPFTESLTPGPVVREPGTPVVRSAALVGMKLSNINYFKNKQDPIAMDDSEYPLWLWNTLDAVAKIDAAEEEVGDIYSKSKKARRIAKKRAAKLAVAAAANPEKRVPINEQTVDIPFATVSNAAHGPATMTSMRRVVATIGGVCGQLLSEKPAGMKAGLVVRSRHTTLDVGAGAEAQVTAELAARARAEVKKAMRKKGRAKIKEANFLSQM